MLINRDAELASDPSSANVDIKEELCDSPGAPLPQHAVSKIQVRPAYEVNSIMNNIELAIFHRCFNH